MECGVFFLAVLAVVLLYLVIDARSRLASIRKEIADLKAINARSWERLNDRLKQLETNSPAPAAPEQAGQPAQPAAPPMPSAPAPKPPAPEIPPAPSPIPSPTLAPASVQPPPSRVGSHTELLEGPEPRSVPAPYGIQRAAAAPIPRPSPTRPPFPPPPPRPRIGLDAPPPEPEGPSLLDRLRAFNWEELLGTQVFLRLGVAVVVLGVVLFLGYVFAKVGPAGKVGMGVGAGLAMLGAGLYAESKEAWNTFGRVVIAGAWGVLYFVAYAMRFLPASQVIQSTPLAVALLLAVATAAVAFSLRYQREWTTAFAFGLIFLSLGMAAVELHPPFNLTADLIASTALATLAWRLGWARLLGLGALAAWGCLGLWIVPHPETHQSIHLGLKLLGLFATWLAFSLPILGWPGRDKERWLGLASLTSTLAALGLGLHLALPAVSSLAWTFPLVIGAAALASSFQLRARERRELFKLQATLGLMALALVGPIRMGFHNGWVPVFRLVGIEALLAAGIFLRERYFRLLANLAFAVSFAEIFFLRLGLFGGPVPDPHARLALLSIATLLPLMNAFLSRARWAEILEGRELDLAAPGMSAAGTLFLACLIWIEAPAGAVALLLALSALLFQEAALRSGHRDLHLESALLWVAAFVSLFTTTLPALAQGHLHSLTLASVAGAFYLAYARSRTTSLDAIPEPPRHLLGRLQLATGAGLVIWLAFSEARPAWVAPALGLLALLHLLIALRAGYRELWFASGAFWIATFGAVLGVSWQLGTPSGIPGCSLRLLSVAGALSAGYLAQLLSRMKGEGNRLQALGLAFALVLAGLIWTEASPIWCAPLMGLAMLVHLVVALRARARVLLYQGCLLGLAALAAVFARSWWVAATFHGIAGRSLSVGLAVMAWYTAHALCHRAERQSHPLADALGTSWSALTDATVIAATALLAWTLKAEALAHDKNLLVALAWGLLGIGHLEGARHLRRRSWFILAETLLAAGALHLLLVNLVQEGTIGFLSLRTLTVLPFLALLAFAHYGWDPAAKAVDLPERISRLKALGVYAGAILGASYLLYELNRAWVLAAWSALAVGYLLVWKRVRNPSLRWIATGLLVASLVRAVGTNLYLRDEFRGFRMNLIVVPGACLLMLLGYLLIRKGEPEDEPLPFAGSRTWLTALLGLLTAYFYVEASGKALTIWWSLEGLAAVGLGFMVAERWSRLAGLGLLTFCILKLFFYDLRDLSGLPRIASFIVLGLVLVGVSWVYTRFKDRLL